MLPHLPAQEELDVPNKPLQQQGTETSHAYANDIFVHIIEDYSDPCKSKVKQQKMHCNEGCAIVKIFGDCVNLGVV